MRVLKFLGITVCLIAVSIVRAADSKCNYFWMAVKKADQIALVNSKGHGSDLKVTGFLSGEKWDGKINFPNWIIWQVRKQGKYLLPVSKDAKSYIITGQRYNIPAVKDTDIAEYEKLISKYKKLDPENEKEFLKKLIYEGKYPSLDFASIRRLSGLGEFAKVMAKQDCNFWKFVYLQNNLNIGTKRYLLYELSRNNFFNCIEIYKSALKTPELSNLTGNIFLRRDEKEFEKLMIKWLADEKLRKFALANSGNMVKNSTYVAEAMKYFKPEGKQDLKDFIPILCAANDTKAHKFIKDFLTQNKDPKDFMLHFLVLNGINNSNSAAYAKELKVFLNNHKNNRFIRDGAAYPIVLSCLCKAADVDGYQLTLEYISKLKVDSKQPLDKAKVNNFMRVFYSYNPKLHKVEQIKEDIESKLSNKRQAP